MTLKILHIVSLLDKEMGGSVIAAFDIAVCAQHENDVHNTVVGPVSKIETLAFFKKEYPKINVKSFPISFLSHSLVSIKLMKWLWTNISDFDVVHCHSIFKFPTLIGAHIARIKKVPLVVSPHNSLDPYDLKKKFLIKKYLYGPLLLKSILTYAQSLLCTTPLEKERLNPFTNDYVANDRPLPISIGLPKKSFDIKVVNDFREDLGISKETIIVLYLSRIDKKKGLDLLIESVNSLTESGADIKLLIAGSGNESYVQYLKGLSKENVLWMGFVDGHKKDLLFRAADIFALTSHNENFGIVVAEAMSYGKAILISDEVYIYPSLAELDAAVICKPEISSVRNCLKELVYDSKRRNLVSSNALRQSNIFTVEKLSIEYFQFYNSVKKIN